MVIELNNKLIHLNANMFDPKKFIMGRKNKQQLVADMEQKLMDLED
jgi:hypothetical protein